MLKERQHEEEEVPIPEVFLQYLIRGSKVRTVIIRRAFMFEKREAQRGNVLEINKLQTPALTVRPLYYH